MDADRVALALRPAEPETRARGLVSGSAWRSPSILSRALFFGPKLKSHLDPNGLPGSSWN